MLTKLAKLRLIDQAQGSKVNILCGSPSVTLRIDFIEFQNREPYHQYQRMGDLSAHADNTSSSITVPKQT